MSKTSEKKKKVEQHYLNRHVAIQPGDHAPIVPSDEERK